MPAFNVNVRIVISHNVDTVTCETDGIVLHVDHPLCGGQSASYVHIGSITNHIKSIP